MIREIKTYYIILCLCSLSFSQDNVDVVTKVATSAANWLKLETGTRAIGMGGAYTAAGDDVSGIIRVLNYVNKSENKKIILDIDTGELRIIN